MGQYYIQYPQQQLTDNDVIALTQAQIQNYRGLVRLGGGTNLIRMIASEGLSIGGSSFASSPFSVDMNGAMTATAFTPVKSFTAGQALSAGDVVYLASDGLVYKAHAGSSAITARYTGIVKTGASSGNTVLVQSTGNFTTSGLTAGLPYYLQNPSSDQSQGTGGSSSSVSAANWAAQTFTAGVTAPNAAVSLTIRDTGARTGGNITIGIRAVDGSNKPTGSDLASTTINAASITNFYSTYSIYFTGAPYVLSSGTMYAIVVRYPGGSGSDVMDWSIAGSSVYGGGAFWTSSDSGSTWSGGTVDATFTTYYALDSIGTSAGSVSKQVGIASSTTVLALT